MNEKLLVVTFKGKYNDIVNSSICLSELEEMQSCIYCVEKHWIRAVVFLASSAWENCNFNSKTVCKQETVSDGSLQPKSRADAAYC